MFSIPSKTYPKSYNTLTNTILTIYGLNKKISRLEGSIMFVAFVAYNIYLISTQTL